MKRSLFVILFLMVFLGTISSAFAQLTGTKNIPGDYATLAAAVTDVNTLGVGAGGVTFNLVAGNPQTAPAGGYSITATGTAANPIIFTGNGNTITAPTPQVAGTLHDAIFEILGGDYITIQGFVMQENAANTITAAATNTMTEFGVAIFYASVTNGAKNVTIQNNTITLNRTYQNTMGIYATDRHTSTVITTAADITAATGAHDNLKIYGNTISNVNLGIVLIGSATGAYMATGIDIGGTSAATGNTITNYGTTGTFSGYLNVSGTVNAINLNNAPDFNISYNTITSSVGGVTAATTLRAVYVAGSGTLPSTGTFNRKIIGNSVSLKHGSASSAIHGFYIDNGNATISTTVNNNDFHDIGWTASSSGALYFVYIAGTPQSLTGSYNTFTNLNLNTSGAVYFFSHGYSMPTGGTQTFDYNSIVGTFTKSVAGGSLYFTNSNSSSPTGTTFYFRNNNFSNITVTGATTIYGVNNTDGGLPTKYVNGNTFSNWTGGTGSITGMTVSYNANSEIMNNSVNTITGTGAVSGIVIGSAGTATLIKVENNVVYGLTGTGVVQGISVATPSTVTGLMVNKNKIYNLTGNGTSGYAYGLVTSAIYPTIYNNLIYDLKAPDQSLATSPAIQGIRITAGTTSNIYHNTVYLDATGNYANFSSASIYISGGTANEIRNNIFVNKAVPGASGRSVSMWKTTAGTANLGANSNTNIHYAGSPDASHLIGYFVSTSYPTLPEYKAALATIDQGSYTEDVVFVNGASPYDLHIEPTTPTRVEGGGQALAAVTTDFDGDTRNATTPDIGADEGDFTQVMAPPGAPLLSTPLAAATNVSIVASLNWNVNAEGGAPTNYDVFLGQVDPPDFVVNQTGSSYTPAAMQFNKTYYWKVKAYNEQGDAESETRSFTTIDGVPALTTPANAATNIAIVSNLTWTAIPGVSGYKVNIGTSSGASDVVSAALVVTNSYTTPALLFGTTYYWTVTSVNGGDEVISLERSFTTVSGVPLLTSPANAATAQARILNLTWSAVTGVTQYKVRVGTSSGATDIVNDVTVGTTTYQTPALSYLTTYYWSVFSVNGPQTVQSLERSFTTMADPSIYPPTTQDFATVPPTNWTRFSGTMANPITLATTTSGWTSDTFANAGSTCAKLNIYGTTCNYWLVTPPIGLGAGGNFNLEFNLAMTKWNQTTIGDQTGTDDKFVVIISTDEGATWNTANILRKWDNAGSAYVYNNISLTGETVVIPLSGYTGSVKVAFYGESTLTNADNDLFIDNFTIYSADVPPTAVTSGTPANNAVDQNPYQSLSWSGASSNPAGYRLYLSTDGLDFTLQSTQATSTYTPSVAWTYSQKYYWRVDAYNDHGTATGPVWNFTVMADPTIYTLPYLNDFESNINGWTILNSNGDSKLWARTADTAPNYAMMIAYNSTLAMNDWFVTPPVQLTAGTTYEVKYNYKVSSATYPENLAVAWGTMPTAASLTHVIANHPGIINLTYNVGRGTFTPSTTGAYYIGFYGYSAIDMFNLFVDNVRITTVDNDLVNATATTSGGTSSPNPQPIYNPVTNSALDTALTITGLSGTPTIVATVGWNNPAVGMGTDGLYVRLSGTEFNNTHVNINHNLGFIPAQLIVRAVGSPEWTVLNPPTEAPLWTAADSFFDIFLETFGKANAIEVVFPAEQDQTLPIELSSFTATLTADMFVQIAWMVQSETNHMGYNVLRNTERDLATAVAINSDFISDGDQLGSQISYSFIDAEVYNNTTYYYWLQSFDLGGTAQFYGPLTVLVNGNDDPGIPEIPVVTQLMEAYPNPFNPSTTLRYAIKDAGKVRIDVFNVRGQLLRSFEHTHATPGYYNQVWDGKDASGLTVGSGVYLYRMTSGKFVSTKKVVMSK